MFWIEYGIILPLVFALAILILYVPTVALYQRIRFKSVAWRFLLLRGLSFAASFGLLMLAGGISIPLTSVFHGSVLLWSVLGYPFWFVIFSGVHFHKMRASTEKPVRVALIAALRNVSFMAFLQIITVLFDFHYLELSGIFWLMPMVMLVLGIGWPFFKWGNNQPPQDAMHPAQA